MTRVVVTVCNPADREKSCTGKFLVDTGATDCLVPTQYLAAIGLAVKGQRKYALADGSELCLSITTGDLEFMDEVVGATIVMRNEETEPLLGVTALESVGIEVDTRNQQLKRLPYVRLR